MLIYIYIYACVWAIDRTHAIAENIQFARSYKCKISNFDGYFARFLRSMNAKLYDNFQIAALGQCNDYSQCK
jgi:hypothetical protein